MANLVVYKGRTYKVSDLSKIYGIPSRTISRRLKSGWSVDDAVETPIQSVNQQVDLQLRKDTSEHNIYFTNTIPSVSKEMQPVHYVIYEAKKYIASEKELEYGNRCADFFIIFLDKDKPLIVYEGEFHYVTEQTQVVAGLVVNHNNEAGDSNAGFFRLWNT